MALVVIAAIIGVGMLAIAYSDCEYRRYSTATRVYCASSGSLLTAIAVVGVVLVR